jgi:hypothetical protein
MAELMGYKTSRPYLYQDEDTGLLCYVNALGHIRQISVEQWAGIIQAAVTCQCGWCIVCAIYEETLHIAEGEE